MWLLITTEVAVVKAATREEAILQFDALDDTAKDHGYEIYSLGEE